MSKTPTRQERLRAVQKNTQKAMGKHHLVFADAGYVKRPMIPINCIQMDAAMGGGFQAGGFHLLWGWEAGGKTTTALKALSNAQKMCAKCTTFIQPSLLVEPIDEPDEWLSKRWQCQSCFAPYHEDERPISSLYDWTKEEGGDTKGIDKAHVICVECGVHGSKDDVFGKLGEKDNWDRIEGDANCECGANEPSIGLFVDFEGRLDLEWAQALGVDSSRMLLEEPEYGEAGVDVIRECIGQGVVDFVVIDSISHITASAEIDATSEDAVVGTSARLVNRFLRQLPGLQHRARNDWGVRPTVIGINQVRHKIGTFGGHTTFGGEGQKFSASSTVKFTSSNAERDRVQVGRKTRKEYLGLAKMTTIKARTEKSSVRAVRSLDFEMYLVTADHDGLRKGEFDDYSLTYNWGRSSGIIEKRSSGDPGYRKGLPWSVRGWPQTFRTAEDLQDEMHRNPFFKMHIHRHVIQLVHEDWTVLKEKLE